MVRDGVANIVVRLRECGLDPRRVGEDAWESRCPGHRSADNALSITRNEFNHAVLECRGADNCQHLKIIRALGMTNDQLYAETPDWLIASSKRVEIGPSLFMRNDAPEHNGADQARGEGANGSAEAPPPSEASPSADAIDWCAPGSLVVIPSACEVPAVEDDGPHAYAYAIDQSVMGKPAAQAVAAVDGVSLAGTDVRALAVSSADEDGGLPVERLDNIADMDLATSSRAGDTLPAPAVVPGNSPVEVIEESPTDALMRVAGVERVILGSDGRSYALVSLNGRAECRELRSKAFRHLLARAGLRETGKLPAPDAISAAVGVLEANGEFEGEHADVFLRVARGRSGSSYFLDLADQEGRVIEIRADGWKQIVEPPVLMRRARGQLALPMPAHDGSLELLKKYINVDEIDWPLLIGWLTAALRPVGPHPILVITAEHGSAKTTMLKVCRRLIDPHASPVRSQPRELRDVMIAARNNWLMAYSNITSLPAWFSNGLCGLATGTGFTIRSVGTDDEESIFVAQRPIILDGIDDFVIAPDLADRSFFLHLPPISRQTRQLEETFWSAFERDYARLLGGLLDAVTAGMRMLPGLHLTELSRMADAERWGEAVARGLGWAPGTFTSALAANRALVCSSALEDSVLADNLIQHIVHNGPFTGVMHDLLSVLTSARHVNASRSDWPKTPRALSCKLRHLAPQLRTIGIDVEFGRSNHNRIVTITMARGVGSLPRYAVQPAFEQRARADLRERAGADKPAGTDKSD